jgi:hypothetical protein
MEYRMSTLKLVLTTVAILATLVSADIWVESTPTDRKWFLRFAGAAMASLWLAQKGRETL